MKQALLLSIILLSMTLSCVEPIVMDPLEEMPVVVMCTLIRDLDTLRMDQLFQPEKYGLVEQPVQYLDLNYARRPSDDRYTQITDASVTVTGAGKEYHFLWNGTRWECPLLPAFGETYRLEIVIPGHAPISAETTFPLCTPIKPESSFPTPQELQMEGGWANWFLEYRRYENHAFQSGWRWGVYCIADYHKMRVHPEINIPYTGRACIWIRATEGGRPVSRILTSHSGADDFNICSGSWSDYPAYQAFRLHPFGGGILNNGDFPPEWITDYLHQMDSLCSASPSHLGFLRICHDADCVGLPGFTPDPEKNAALFTLAASFDPNRMISYDDPYHYDIERDGMSPGLYIDTQYEVFFLSEEYDQYFKDVINSTEIQFDNLAESYYSPDKYRSNIQGGIGCFGAVFRQTIGYPPIKDPYAGMFQ